MNWVACSDVSEFLRSRGAELKAHESTHNLAWAAIRQAQVAGPHAAEESFFTFNAGETSTAHAFVNTSRQHLTLSTMTPTQAEKLAHFLVSRNTELTVAEGPQKPVHAFVREWSSKTGCAYKIQFNQGLYELTRVNMPDLEGGHLVLANHNHTGIVEKFVTGFWRDCFPNEPSAQAMMSERAHRFLSRQNAYLWQNRNHELVSMAVVIRESPNTSSISGVYTDPNHRSRGYAARTVASLSQACIDAGKTACNLYTDLENNTSNSVYIRIGYSMIQQSTRIRIMRPAATTDHEMTLSYRTVDFQLVSDCTLLAKWLNDPALKHLYSRFTDAENFAQDFSPEHFQRMHPVAANKRTGQEFMVLVDGTPIGTANFEIDSPKSLTNKTNTAWIALLIGEAQMQRKGLGKRVVRHLEHCAEAAGGERIEVGVFEYNDPSIHFFSSLGYTEFARQPEWAWWDGRLWPVIRMLKEL